MRASNNSAYWLKYCIATGMSYWLRAAPALLSSVILGAHFLRQGSLTAASICLALPLAALLLRLNWALPATRLLLWTGALLWILNGIRIAQDRMGRGEPWQRMALILGAVALWTAFSAWLLSGKIVAERMRASTES